MSRPAAGFAALGARRDETCRAPRASTRPMANQLAKDPPEDNAMAEAQVVLVTGAAGNLGAATAAALRRRGVRLVLVDRTLAKLERAHSAEMRPEDELLIGDVDLTDAATLAAIVVQAQERFGALDGLVNTVGAYRAGKALHDEDLATWDFLLSLNLRTALVACRAALPGMLARGRGRIVNVASRDALVGSAGEAAYAASKAALLRMTESAAADCAGRGVTVNCVLPGTIDTPQNRVALPAEAHGRLVPADAIADVIAFLLSPAARALSGAAIPVLGA
jgi:NAD(P)-dependent dehydrogenase (short-subunit alcohol dehydrogenase family)